MTSAKIKSGLKFIITGVLVSILLWRVDWKESLVMLPKISLIYIFLLITISVLMISISCIKWQIFLRARNIYVSLIRLFLLYLIGYFFNNFLPTNVGGDVARSFILGKQIANNPDSFGSVFLERFTGLFGLVVLAIFAFLFNLRIIQKPTIGLFLIFFLTISLLIILLLFTERSHNLTRKILRLTPFRIIKKQAYEFLNVIYYFRNQPIVLSKTMAISFLFHIMAIVNALVICLALEIHVAVLDLAVIIPLILLISMIPISLNSIGIFEGSFVYFFSLIGIPASAALSVALVLRAKNLFIAMVGGAVFGIWNKLPKKQFKIQLNENQEKTNLGMQV